MSAADLSSLMIRLLWSAARAFRSAQMSDSGNIFMVFDTPNEPAQAPRARGAPHGTETSPRRCLKQRGWAQWLSFDNDVMVAALIPLRQHQNLARAKAGQVSVLTED